MNTIIYCVCSYSHYSFDFWKILMVGPTDTPYESGVFSLYAEFPSNYPGVPPTVRFLTPVSFLICVLNLSNNPNVTNIGSLYL